MKKIVNIVFRDNIKPHKYNCDSVRIGDGQLLLTGAIPLHRKHNDEVLFCVYNFDHILYFTELEI